ncbi:hypothetical protein BGZ83_008272 [Gryganskiella cystojenkinii]|nr:hypothetical protein BGZ83_008272 [Gryganskiella cystojenkinii]
MSDAWDDWEQADEAEIQAPVPKPAQPNPWPSLAEVAESASSSSTPKIMKRNPQSPPLQQKKQYHSQEGPFGFDQRHGRQANNGGSLHELNRALWDKANEYEAPIIARTDNNNMRTEYVPEIRILQRPKSTVAVARGPIISKPLAEREADYQAAREKIFGPSPTPTPAPASNNRGASPSSPSTSRPSSGRSSPHRSLSSSSPMPPGPDIPRSESPLHYHHQEQQQKSAKPIEFKGKPTLIKKAQKMNPDTAIRQPQGPTMASSTSHNNQLGRGGSNSTRGNRGHQGKHLQESSSQSPVRGEKSIGFGKPLRGAPRHPTTSTLPSTSAQALQPSNRRSDQP